MLTSLAQTRYVQPGIGTGAGTIGDPWSQNQLQDTINAGGLAPGYTVYFLTGSYEATLDIVGVQGTQGNPVVFAGAPGNDPVFTGSKPIPDGSWSAADPTWPAGTYKTGALPDGTNAVFNLYADGGLRTLARWPDTGYNASDLLRFKDTVFVGLDTILVATLIDTDLATAGWDWTGATLVARYASWGYAKRVVDSFGGDSIVIPRFGGDVFDGNWGYWMENRKELLDAPGEWFFDTATDTLFYWPLNSGSPAGVRVSTNVDHRGMTLNARVVHNDPLPNDTLGNTHVIIRDLTFEHYYDDLNPSNLAAAIKIRRGPHHHITVEGCTFRDLHNGINDVDEKLVDWPKYLTYQNNTFERVHGVGVRTGTIQVLVQNNTFRNISTLPGQTGPYFADATAIVSNADDCIIRFNVLDSLGGSGINASGRNDTTYVGSHRVENNFISNACMALNDHAAITFDNCDSLVIRNNIIHRMTPNVESSADGDPKSNKSVGIYFGYNTITHTVVENNTISLVGNGIVADHEPGFTGNRIQNNTVFNCEVQLALLDRGDPDATNWTASYDDVYTGNILYCLSEEQLALWQSNSKANTWDGNATRPLIHFGTFSDNYYFNPFSDLVNWFSTGISVHDTSLVLVPRTFPQWQQMFNEDLDSHLSPLHIKRYIATCDTATEWVTNGGFSPGISGWQGYPQTVVPGAPGGFGSGGILVSPGGEWIYNAGALRPLTSADDGTYLFRFDIKGQTPGVIKASILEDGSYNMPGKWTSYDSTNTLTRRELLIPLTVVPPDSSGYAILHDIDWWARSAGYMQPLANDDIYLDSVSIQKCTVVYQDSLIALNHILRYNNPLDTSGTDPQDVESFELIGCWSDVYGTIYSGTVTLDPWESKALYRIEDQFDIDMAGVDPPEYHIGGNVQETWNTNKNVRGSIVVENGGQLIIDGATIGFADSRQEDVLTNIVVEPGGYLQISNGATLTTIPVCGANSMWDGIKVLGADPEHPGTVHVYGGTIENALTAILSGDSDPADPGYVGSEQGGYVSTSDAHFLNNQHDVVFLEYPGPFPQPGYSMGSFQRTEFKTTTPLNYADRDPVVHIRTAESAIGVNSCLFANDLPEHTQSHRMGNGIEVLNAHVGVIPNGLGDVPIFRNLDHAVHATTSQGSPFTLVRGSTFTDNICAAYLADVPGFAIRGNVMEMGRWDLGVGNYTHPDEEHWGNAHRGIFTTGSNAFTIMDNTLSLSAGGTAPTEGIVVGYTNDANEVVFRNTVTDLDLGFVGEGICADVDNDPAIVGLQFQCNTNSSNAANFTSRRANGDDANAYRHTIRGRQGTTAIGASNAFDGTMHFAIDTRADALEYVEYSYATGQGPATYTQQDLNDLDADYLTPAPVNSSINCASEGPVYVVGGGHTFAEVKPYLTGTKYTYGNLRYQLEQLIDGGNTDEVVEEIVAAWPQEILDLRASLLARSPYLSVDVLKSLMTKPGVPDAIRAEVLIANPDATKKDGFLKWAELEAPYPLPGYLADAVEASWNTRTYRTTLEEYITDEHTRLTQTAWYAINLLQTDTAPPDPDTLRWVWQQVRTNGARFAEAALLLGQGEFAEAEAVISAMPTEKEQKPREENERQRMLTYIGVLAGAATESRNAYQLNAGEVQALDEMVGTHYDHPANWASNLLCAVYKKCRPPYTGDANTPKSNRSRQRNTDAQLAQSSTYGVQPNPARGTVVFTYDDRSRNEGPGRIEVRDLSGRRIATLAMNGAQGQQTWDVQGVASGTYLVEYIAGARSLHTERLVIQ